MSIDYDRLINWPFSDITQSYTRRDCILYALGVGLGQPADDAGQLRFVYEKVLLALPTMAGILGYRGFWLDDPRTGVNWQQALGGGVAIRLDRPLPAEATIRSTQRVADLIDRGPGRGAVLFNERDIRDAATGERYGVVEWTNFLRGDGGFGGPQRPLPRPHPIPDRAADRTVDLPVAEQAALIFRLNGDHNPLHCDPEVAANAGFARPILHGQATFGMVGHAILSAVTGYRPEPLRSLALRFVSPVFPGETVRVELWIDGPVVSCRALVPARGKLVVDHGRAELAPD